MPLGNHLYQYICNDLKDYQGNYLEIGVFDGDGFVRVATEYKDKKCYAVDPFIEDGYTSLTSAQKRGNKLDSQKQSFLNCTQNLSNIEHFEMTSVDFFNNFTEQKAIEMNVSFVLIDGSHHYDDVVNDYKLSVELIKKTRQGIIVFDDLAIEGVKKAFDQFEQEYKNYIVHSSGIGGDAVSVKINFQQ